MRDRDRDRDRDVVPAIECLLSTVELLDPSLDATGWRLAAIALALRVALLLVQVAAHFESDTRPSDED